MKAIMVMFDSLNRRYLPNYGCNWVKAPNFERLQEKAVTFDNCYVGSMPCMPARREIQTGRYNFLHRSWGPMEPYDDSMPELLNNAGIYSHLVSDHGHYWEDGGATYHTRYTSWEISRGQEGDPWKGVVEDPEKLKNNPYLANIKGKLISNRGLRLMRQDIINRENMQDEEKMSQAVTFRHGLDFIEKNHSADDWFLQLETFDPHEPFFASKRFKELYPDVDYNGEDFDWPPYGRVTQDEKTVLHIQKNYAALVSMCDYYLGQVLNKMDAYDMWKDTMLIVNTDHGYLLGEHGWWSKTVMPVYNEIAQIPLFIWNPKLGVKGVHRKALVQTIDLAPTILSYFNVDIPKDMDGKPLEQVILEDKNVREYALFGYHGCQINITDGKYVYMRSPQYKDSHPIYEYTHMASHMRCLFSVDELKDLDLGGPFKFTKGTKLMKIASKAKLKEVLFSSALYCVEDDPNELYELDDIDQILRLSNAMLTLMRENDAPVEQYERMGFPIEGSYTLEHHKKYLKIIDEQKN